MSGEFELHATEIQPSSWSARGIYWLNIWEYRSQDGLNMDGS